MFCTQCGYKNDENALFCSSCGGSLNKNLGNPIGTVPLTQSQNPSTSPINARKKFTKKKLVISVLIIAVAISIIYVGMSVVTGGYSQKTPEKAIKSIFRAIDNMDVERFTSMLSDDSIANCKQVVKEDDSYDDLDELIEAIIKNKLSSTSGESWVKITENIDVNIDNDSATAEIEFSYNGKRIKRICLLVKEDSKWFIESDGWGNFLH